MSDDKERAGIAISAERPLDALLPELRAAREPRVPVSPIHPRVLEVELENGREWTLACWRDPGGARAFHTQVLAMLEATILAELSRPPRGIAAAERSYTGVRLIVFPELPFDPGPAVQAFGMTKAAYVEDAYAGRVSVLRREARELGIEVGEHPSQVWASEVRSPDGSLGEKLMKIHQMMATRMEDDVWGKTPGGPSKLFALYAEREFGERIPPTLDGLRAFELLVVRHTRGVIRWIYPLLFQALCDFIGVVAQAEFGAKIAWSVCEEPESGLAPPPLFRVVEASGGTIHIPIAHHVLRWSMMPLGDHDEVPSLAAWMADQFRGS